MNKGAIGLRLSLRRRGMQFTGKGTYAFLKSNVVLPIIS